MNKAAFLQKLARKPHPVIVDFWAPWCGPCKVIKPILEKLAKQYAGKVELWQINADDHQGLLQELGIRGIPTLIVYRKDDEILRSVGAKPASALQKMFETLAEGKDPEPIGISLPARILRLGAGALAIGWGLLNGYNVIAFVLGGLLLFSAVYDRCPIWRAITNYFKKRSETRL